MSTVFLAEDPQGNRVALKTLGSTLTEDRDRERFEREGVLLSRLKHPNIVSTVGIPGPQRDSARALCRRGRSPRSRFGRSG